MIERTLVELLHDVVEVAESVESVLSMHLYELVAVGVPLGHTLRRVFAPVLREVGELITDR